MFNKRRKEVLALAAALILSIEAMSAGVYADSPDEKLSKESEIEWQEIHIKSSDDLIIFAKQCRLDAYSKDKKVYLDEDINMSNIAFEGIPYFDGQFYGQGHTIENVRIYADKSYLGFFSRIDTDGVVSNLNIVGRVTPPGTQTIIGGLAGDNKGIISGCSYSGTIHGEDYIGGIAGINDMSGIIVNCKTHGYLLGNHFTGGIAGENMGNIMDSVNLAEVNTTSKDAALSIQDISIDTILSGVGIGDIDKDEAESTAILNGAIDTGGIAGLSTGVIQNCKNDGTVGYSNVGYNVGGIAGRQSGYILNCQNSGNVLGRKDVGGIVGQAEPYVTIDFANDITSQMTTNIEKLHDMLAVTLDDLDTSSDVIASRLSVIKQFTDNALNDTRFLENETIDWANAGLETVNEAVSRVDYIMDEAAKKDGVIDKTTAAAGDAKDAMEHFDAALEHLDIYTYMSKDEQEQYDKARQDIKDATEEHSGYVDEVYGNMYNYYLHKYSYDAEFNTADVNEKDLAYKNEEGSYLIADYNHGGSAPSTATYANPEYSEGGKWVHCGAGEAGEDVAFPGGEQSQIDADTSLISKATKEAGNASKKYADIKYSDNDKHKGHSYADDTREAAEVLAEITLRYSNNMSDDAKEEAKEAVDSLKSAMSNLQSAGEQTKDIIDNVNGRGDLNAPKLSSDYKYHANSLTNNIQGMADNFNILSSEMNASSDSLIDDLRGINDQFNVIMQLFTDAIDGVLDDDYSSVYVDNSLEVCRSTTDATVDSCTNRGKVEGSINAAGISGTMAIEYDFDLESDITGLKDAALNRSYQTKCVLRDNVNKGKVTARKDYAGGICGLQELGTITGGENYGKITSATASYVGGIAGSSVSSIVDSFAKCSLSGTSYVGGIAGDGARIYNSLSMVTIADAKEWFGAIAGHIDDDSDIANNFFVSDELAGIDRVSYVDAAQPIDYAEIDTKISNKPAYFNNMFIDFMLDEDSGSDDDDQSLLERKAYNYNQAINAAEYPEVPQKEGYYTIWDIESVDAICSDMVITASYARNNTTLAGRVLRESKQSALLVDGVFREDEELNDILCVDEADALPNAVEYWDLTIPEDGQDSHMLRYAKPENLKKWPDIYIYGDNGWNKLDTEDMGSCGIYRTFKAEGNHVKLQMVYAHAKIQRVINILIGFAILALIAVAAGVVIIVLKSRKKVESKVRERAHAIIERAEAREPAIKFVEEENKEAVKEEADSDSKTMEES